MDLQPFYGLINWLAQSVLLPVLGALLCAGLFDLYLKGRALLASKIGADKEALVEKTVRRFVLAAESYFAGPGRGSEKMTWVLKMAQAYLASKGVKNVDIVLLEQWAEAILRVEINNYPDLTSFTTNEASLNSGTIPPQITPPGVSIGATPAPATTAP